MNRKTGITLAVLVVVVLAGWLLSSFAGSGTPDARPSAAPSSVESSATTKASGSTTKPGTQRGGIDPESGLPWVAEGDLPREAREVLRLIDAGGPYAYDKDGSTFGNFEGLLPQQRRGYYREYTVDTPGARNRGARRIVTGDNDRIRYWTDDHYESFARIRR